MKDINSVRSDAAVINVKAGLKSGFIASAISSIALMIMTSIILIPKFNFILIEGSIFGLAETVLYSWIIYFVFGLIWGYVYALSEPALKVANSSFVKGIIAGFIIWIILLIFMPIAGAGIFLKHYGLKAAVIILIANLVFGIVLGYFYDLLRTVRK